MGNKLQGKNAEAANYGGIYVQLNEKILIPGTTASGTIYLDLTNDYPGNKICLEITGSESTRWTDRVRKTRKRGKHTQVYYVNVRRSGTRNIINNHIDLYVWQQNSIIPRGQYTFPFQFLVPNGLPGSFFFRRGTAIAEIRYSIEAFLQPQGTTIPKLKHKTNAIVREMPRGAIQSKQVSIDKNLKTWCCLDQGTVSLKTSFEKDAYAPGEVARIIAEVDNKSKLALPNIKFSLNQSVHLRAGGHNKHFYYVIRHTDLGKIEAGQSRTGTNRIEASITLPPGQEGKAKSFNMGNDETEADIPEYNPNPSSLITPSTHGGLIKSDFRLVINCEAEGCLCCETLPSNALPITVYSAGIQMQTAPPQPANWQPQQMPMTNFTIAYAPMYLDMNMNMEGAPMQNDMMISNQMPNYNQPNQANQGFQNFQQPQYDAQTYNAQPQAIYPQTVQIGQNTSQYP